MIVCFNCSRQTKEKLDRLLAAGEYTDYSEAISFAIEHALMLQEEVLESGSLVIDSTVERSFQESAVADKQKKTKGTSPKVKNRANPHQIPDLFTSVPKIDSPPLAQLPSDMWMKGQEVPLDRWIFGQHNKLLPAKASCRALASLTVSEPQGIPLNKAAECISEAALSLGDFLSSHDDLHDLKRDNALSIAFPTSGKGEEKSCRRYANHFVANTNKHEQLTGLLFNLKLINQANGDKKRLLLTEPGWEFAKKENPILDNFQRNPTQKFSAGERHFLLEHISRSVPVEDYAYKTILKIISEGVNTPSEVDSSLRARISEKKKEELSSSFLSSQRSGAVSRMEDLGLIERVRNGIRISYAITELGRDYISDES